MTCNFVSPNASTSTVLRAFSKSALLPSCSARVEIFSRTNEELRDQVRFFRDRGFRMFNLVNLNENDPIRDWVNMIQKELLPNQCSICAHYSLKYNRNDPLGGYQGSVNGVPDDGLDTSNAKLLSFLLSLGGEKGENLQYSRNKSNPSASNLSVLLVSGDGIQSPHANDSVKALQILSDNVSSNPKIKKMLPPLAVAFNPYSKHRVMEKERLLQKMDEHHIVKNIYLQFGTDLPLLQASLDWLLEDVIESQKYKHRQLKLSLGGSIFVPTPKVIQFLKSKSLDGVFLSNDFLYGSEDQARKIVSDIMGLYQQYGVEVLFQTPGVRGGPHLEEYCDLMEALMTDL